MHQYTQRGLCPTAWLVGHNGNTHTDQLWNYNNTHQLFLRRPNLEFVLSGDFSTSSPIPPFTPLSLAETVARRPRRARVHPLPDRPYHRAGGADIKTDTAANQMKPPCLAGSGPRPANRCLSASGRPAPAARNGNVTPRRRVCHRRQKPTAGRRSPRQCTEEGMLTHS